MTFKTSFKERLRRFRYIAEMRRRGVCGTCFEPKEPGRKAYRCRECTRRAYVRLRIKRCRHYIAQYQRELLDRLAESRALTEKRRQDRRLDRAA